MISRPIVCLLALACSSSALAQGVFRDPFGLEAVTGTMVQVFFDGECLPARTIWL